MRLALLAWTLAGIWGCASAPPSPVPAPGPTAARPSPAPVATPAATPLVEAPRCPAVTVEVPEVPVGGEDAPVPPVLHDETLAPFFEKVARLLRGQATEHLRIAVYGDSNLTMDFLSGQLRRRLQARHGDAGHGFVALGQPWSHYKHMDVRHGVKSNITSYACSTHPILDHIYGISGIAGESQGLGGRAWVGTARGDAPIGKTASRFEVYYLEGKDRGQFAIEADGKELMRVESEAPELGVGVRRFELPDAPHEIAVVTTDGRRRVRFLGLTMERDVPPSFVVDAFGVGSMNTHAQHRQNAAINHEMLEERGYDLVIFATGANDGFSLDTTPKELGELIERQRKALPDVAILLLTPSDRGRDSTMKQTLDVVKQRYTIAEDNRVALWDLFEAMGGENSMGAFKRRGFAVSDHIHMNEQGGAYLGDRLLNALWTSLAKYLAAHPEAGCAPAPETAGQPGGGEKAAGLP